MRREIIVLGFSLIVLMLIAGCTSTQNGVANGSKNQNPSPSINAKTTTSTNIFTSINECNQPPLDPIKFQKFLPNVPGYDRKYEQNISIGNNYVVFTKREGAFSNFISDWYNFNNQSANSWAIVSFTDFGPCVDSNSIINSYFIGTKDVTTTSKINFHGYPAIHTITFKNSSLVTVSVDHYLIWINNRLTVGIGTNARFYDQYSLSEAEAEIEKFADVIDFKGFAASV